VSLISAIVLIVAIVVIAGAFRNRQQGRRDHYTETFEGSARERELEAEIEQLRERVKVLERIATEDRGAKALAEKIEDLRDD
tara:strand:+ start:744 stop:989 length:246 start_codon:yes stop_codon:yes gene_type:complete